MVAVTISFKKVGENSSENQFYFRRTDEYIIMKPNKKNTGLEVASGLEGIIGEEDELEETVDYTIDSNEEMQEKIQELKKEYLSLGYVLTEPKTRFPSGNYDYDDDFSEKVIEQLENNPHPKHFALITWEECSTGETDDLEEILNYFIENKEKYQDIEYFTFGDMTFEVAEISWIEQVNYNNFFKAFPNIKGFSVQGCMNLSLGTMDLPNLEILEIHCSNLQSSVLKEIQNSNLPNLKKLNLFVGTDEYDCNVSAKDIKEFLSSTNFPKLSVLGFPNVYEDIFSDTLKAIFESKYINQILTLDISKSVSKDDDVKYIIENIKKAEKLKYLDISYNYVSNEKLEELEELLSELDIDFDTADSEYEDYEEGYASPMYTE